MSTNIYSFADSEQRMRWKEPFITEGLNAKHAVVHAPGIYRGFRLEGTGVDCELQITADATHGDQVAVYETSTGYALTLRRIGDITVDLTAFAGQTVYVAIYARYAVSVPTSARIRIYTASELSLAPERPELLVLGSVTVDVGAPITTTTADYRVVASRNVAKGLTPPVALLRNGSFEAGLPNDPGFFAAYFWEKSVSAGTASWRIASVGAPGGSLKSLALNVSGGTVTATLTQPINCPVRAGQVLRLSYKIRVDDPNTAGTVTAGYDFLNANGTTVSAVTYSVLADLVSGYTFVSYEGAVVIPSGVTHLRAFSVWVSGATFASGTNVFYLDDFNLQLMEVEPDFESPHPSALGHIQTAAGLLLEDSTVSAYGTVTALRHKATAWNGSPGLEVGDRDGLPNLLNLLGRLIVGEGLSAAPSQARIRADTSPSNDYTLVVESAGSSGGSVRSYVSGAGFYILTLNARWTGTEWTRDVASGVGSFLLLLSQQEFGVYDHNVGLADSWDDIFSGTSHWKPTAYFPASVVGSPATVSTALTVAQALRGNTTIQADSTLYAGRQLADSDAGAETPCVVADRRLTPARSLIAEMSSMAGVGVRLYRSYSGSAESLEVAVNAVWASAGALWSRETGATHAVKYAFGPTGLEVYRSSSASWADTSWSTVALKLSATPSPLATFAPAVNSLHAAQLARSWASITTDGAGGVTINDGFNIASATLFGGTIIVVFATPMVDANYDVRPSVQTPSAATWYSAVPFGAAYNSFGISVFEFTGGAIASVNLATTALTLSFSVHAHQS